jgi:biopolymer transport protein ExbB
MKFIDLFFVGGIVMWPILFCSLAAVAIIVQKFIQLHKPEIDSNQLLMRVHASLDKHDVPGAMHACSEYKSPVAAIFRAGLLRSADGKLAMRKAVEAAGKAELFKLEKGLGLLGNIAGVAPMLGFLGTVTGMIRAFQVIQNAGGNVNPTMLAGGIWEAMLATAFGLSVGVPALGFYNHFVQRVTHFVFDIESTSEEFMDMIDHEAPRRMPQEAPMNAPVPHEPQRRLFADDTEFFEPKKD